MFKKKEKKNLMLV